jgi:DNA-binding CsgD family transcriptional regulator
VLGRSFRVDDLAALVRDTPARLLPDIEAALAARILAPVGASLMFRRRLVWHAVEESVPVPARQALHRQAAEYLLERGGSVTEAAAHLVSGSRPCDPVALARLDRAARIHRLTSPQTGADLAVKALELTGPGDGRRLTRLETAVEALAAAGRLSTAEALARSALSQPMPAGMSARLRGMLSAIVLQDGRPGAAVAEAEAVLGERALTSRPRTHAEFVLMLGMSVAGGDGGWGPALADATLAISEQGTEGDVAVVGALLVQALDRWRDGRLGQSLGLSREAARRGMRLPTFGGHMLPRLLLANILVQAGHLDEAASVLRSVRRDAGDLGAPGRDASAEILMASMALAAGHHHDAVSGAQQGLALADLRGTHLFSQLGTSILATAALRTGDLRMAVLPTDALGQQQAADVPCFGQTQSLVVTAQVTEASQGAAEGAALVTPLYDAVARNPSGLLAGSATAGWLTRFALAQQDREQAAKVASAAADLAAANPGFELCAALAAHARGLVDSDAALLHRAAQRSRDPWAKASAHEDLGVLLIGQGDLPRAGRSLEDGLGGYDACGATRDARRVRRRLRKLGIRRRHFSYANRPKSGWDSLTETERAVSELVAQGLTNQKIANEMFLSTHTVAFHLRQVFRKLDISSRVDLARLLTERIHDSATQQAS